MWVCHSCGSERPVPTVIGGIVAPCPSCGRKPAVRDGIVCFAPDLVGSGSGYDPDFFAAFAAVEETNFWFVARARLITGLMARFFPRALSFMEIGCGTGSVLQALQRGSPRLKLYGSELHPEGLSFARQRLGVDVQLMQMDARQIPARDEFDVAGAFDVIEHIVEDDAVLKAMHSAIKPGGGVIVSVPQHPWLWSPFDDAARHERRYQRGELERKMEEAGFRVLASTSYNAVLLPVMVASRVLLMLRGSKPGSFDVMAETKVGGLTNNILKTLLDTEARLTFLGVRWPVGGSRIVVAAKPSSSAL